MGRGVNKVILVGHLGSDPDTRFAASGKAVTKLSLATNEAWTDKQSGQKQERTEWHRVVYFGRLAEIAGQYLRKRSQVYIEGSLRTSKYEKNGQTHYSTEIIGSELQMLGSNTKGSQASVPAHQSNSANAYREASGGSMGKSQDDFDDDIPF